MNQTVVFKRNKKTGLIRRFSAMTWSRLGKTDREGWEDAEEKNLIEDTSKQKVEKPSTGQTEKPVTVKVEGNEGNQVTSTNAPEGNEPNDGAKNAFIAKVEELKISKAKIKNHFDSIEVKYDNRTTLIALAEQLGDEMDYSIEKLEEVFK